MYYEEGSQAIAYMNFSKIPTQDDCIFPNEEYVVLDNIVVKKNFKNKV